MDLSTLPSALSDWVLLSGMRLAAGDSRASARRCSSGLGDESTDNRVASVRRVWVVFRNPSWIAWAGIAAASAFLVCDLRARLHDCFVRRDSEPSARAVQFVGSGSDVGLLGVFCS